MISRPLLAYPKKTFKGRDRVSLVPRWVGSWVMTGGMAYITFSVGAGFFGYSNPLSSLINGQTKIGGGPGQAVTVVPDSPVNIPPSFYASSAGQSLQATQTAVSYLVNPVTSVPGELSVADIMPTFTPYPTLTPYPTQLKRSALGRVFAVGYSYYFPPIGGINCHPDNWVDNYCLDITASGLRWSEYIGRGVAIPIQWADDIPLLSVLRVLDNVIMAGDYVVLDYCGDCIKSEGHVYLDFLDNRPRLNWTVPLLIEIVSVP